MLHRTQFTYFIGSPGMSWSGTLYFFGVYTPRPSSGHSGPHVEFEDYLPPLKQLERSNCAWGRGLRRGMVMK
jgi:hypothetical protein